MNIIDSRGTGFFDAELQDMDSEPMSGRQGSGMRKRMLAEPIPVEASARRNGQRASASAKIGVDLRSVYQTLSC